MAPRPQGQATAEGGRRLGKIEPEGLVPSVGRAERAEARVEVSAVAEVEVSTLVWDCTFGMCSRLRRHFADDWRETYAPAHVRAVWETRWAPI